MAAVKAGSQSGDVLGFPDDREGPVGADHHALAEHLAAKDIFHEFALDFRQKR
jgi:hypothetical protein